jgi:hypothetical protein
MENGEKIKKERREGWLRRERTEIGNRDRERGKEKGSRGQK